MEYFKVYADNHPDINDFVKGNYEDILEMQRSEINYPVFWAEDPEWQINGGDNDSHDSYRCACAFISQAELDNREQEWIILDLLQQIAKQFILQLKEDGYNGSWHLTGEVRTDIIHHQTADNMWGWRLDFFIQNEFDICTEVDWSPIDMTCELAKASIIKKDTDGNCWREELSPHGVPIRTKLD